MHVYQFLHHFKIIVDKEKRTKKMTIYMIGTSILLFLGSGGGGTPYFCRLSFALSLYYKSTTYMAIKNKSPQYYIT